MLLFCAVLLWPTTVAAQTQSEAAAYRQFRNNPSVVSGEAFLNEYPDGKYADKVSDEVCRMLSDGLNAFSVQTDYDNALKYARSTQMRRYAESKISDAGKAQKKMMKEYDARRRGSRYDTQSSGNDTAVSKRRSSGAGIFALGASFLMDYGSDDVLGLGGMVNLRFGNPHNIINGVIGVKYMSVSSSYDRSSFSADQLSVPLTLRFNILRVNVLSASMYIGAGASYNWNMSVSTPSESHTDIDRSLVNSNTYAALGQVGFGGGRIDFNIYFQYDLKPIVAGSAKQFRCGMEIGWYFLRR